VPEVRRLAPEAVVAQLRRRWANGHRDWLDGGGAWPLAIRLGAPTEIEARTDSAGVRGWVEAWLAAERGPAFWSPDGGDSAARLEWAERQWSSLGRQRLPLRLLVPGPAALAQWIGEESSWDRASARAGQIRQALERDGLRLGRHFDWLARCLDSEFHRLIGVLIWLTEHPDSRLYLRQLPIPGIDTKWIEANGGRVTDLLRQLHGGTGDLYSLGGLRRVPDLLRLRILDPQMSRPLGGLSDLSAPLEEIAALPIAPASALIVENLQTGLALPELPGTVAFLARGYAVEAFGAIPWLASCVTHYWGDLDTHGYAILSRLRQYLPRARSLLMDQDTLLAHRSLWQREEKPAPAPLGALTKEEEEVFLGLLGDCWGEHVRLEQERIDWEYASRCIADALRRDRA